jgi:signal transduction histidine kinase/ActR/RegA family two-component response regulator
MKQPGRILILDDEPEWLEMYSAVLTKAGYEVMQAGDESRARELLHEHMFHLLVTDIRLDENPGDGGMKLLQWMAREGLTGGLKTIVSTGHGTVEQMRTAFRNYEVSDFLWKGDHSDETFLNAVSSTLAAPGDNAGVAPEFDGGLSLTSMAARLSESGALAEYTRERLEEECRELLTRLFSEARSILVRPQQVLSLPPLSVRVDLVYGPDKSQTRLLQIGPHSAINSEYEAVGAYFRDLAPLQAKRTPLLGGIVYSLPNLAAFNMYQQDIGRLRRRVSEMETGQEALDKQLEVIAHQINMPIKQVKGIIELLLLQKDGEGAARQQERWLPLALSIIGSAPRLVSRALGMVRLQTGSALSMQRYDVVNCVRKALEGFAAALEKKGLALSADDLPAEGFQVDCDPEFMTYAVEHVLDNAIKFTDRGSVRVGVSDEGDWVKIEVSDTGRGIAARDLPSVFDHGFRAGPTADGWGVGLTHVKEVLGQHGGTVLAESEPGRGTTIIMRLPRRSE